MPRQVLSIVHWSGLSWLGSHSGLGLFCYIRTCPGAMLLPANPESRVALVPRTKSRKLEASKEFTVYTGNDVCNAVCTTYASKSYWALTDPHIHEGNTLAALLFMLESVEPVSKPLQWSIGGALEG